MASGGRALTAHFSIHSLEEVMLARSAVIIAALRKAAKELSNPYRPEQHYMRGPGPKWREKHRA
jgi:hypothetical protein